MGRPARYGAEPALRKKGNGIWEVVWKDPQTGTIHRKTTGKTSETEARAVLHSVARSALPTEPTISELIDRFLERKEKQDRKMPAMKASLRPVNERLGHLTADQLSQDDIDDYYDWRSSQGRWQGDLRFKDKENLGTISDGTINKDLRMLRACLNDSASRRYIGSALKFKNPASESAPRTDWLTKEEIDRVLAVCEGDRAHLYGYILIAVTTGARKAAILNLKWDGVYLPEGSPDPDATFMDLLSARGQPYIDFGEDVDNKRRPKFAIGYNPLLLNWLYFGSDRSSKYVITHKGKHIADVKTGLRTAIRLAGIERRITPHTLKHTAITLMMKNDVPVSYISERVNTSEKTLLKWYGHHRADVAEQLAGIWD